MDIGTKPQPGRELDATALDAVGGGNVLPEENPDRPLPGDILGGPVVPPVDYANVVAGGEDCLTPPTEETPPPNPVIKALQDVWNGIF